MSSCTRILGLETEPNGIDFEGRFAQVGTFPIGIDPYAFVEAVKKPSVLERTRSLEAKFEGKKVIIGVDRLDYIKGLPQKLQSFEVFLSQNPEWVEKVSWLAPVVSDKLISGRTCPIGHPFSTGCRRVPKSSGLRQ